MTKSARELQEDSAVSGDTVDAVEQRRRADRDLFGLELVDVDADSGIARLRMTLHDHLLRIDAKLYGGAALAASCAAIETATGRNAIWTTTQFVASAPAGAVLDVECRSVAAGRRISQAQVGITLDGRLVATSLGAAATAKDDGLHGGLETMPDGLPDAPDCPELVFPIPKDLPGATEGWRGAAELRNASAVIDPERRLPVLYLWARLRGGRTQMSAAAVAFLVDVVPLSIGRGLERFAIGTSLDNTIRMGTPADADWILLGIRPHFAAHGYGSGTATVWTPDGEVLAVAGQTASMTPVPGRPIV